MEIFDVFISYRRSDGQEIADALYAYLAAKGLRVFLDKEKLRTGDTFPEQLKEKLVAAPNYVLIATNDVFKFREGEDWVREEIALALEEHRKNRRDRKIITLVPEDSMFPERDELPEYVQGIEKVQRVEFLNEQTEVCFRKIFETVTEVTGANLWNAAHRWLSENKKSRNRFANLNICEAILPNVKKITKEVEIPISVHTGPAGKQDESKLLSKPLLDAIRESRRHIYLIGQGGIGKTTALMHIMNQAYENESYEKGKQIPIFVELSYAPDTDGALYETEISSFIRRSVYRQMRTDLKVKQVEQSAVDEIDEIFTISPEVAVYPITDIFSKETAAPEYLLLLDGLNEVSTVRLPNRRKSIFQMVSEEIQYLMESCPNVRVVLTSRFDEPGIADEDITRLYLDGVKKDTIEKFLSLKDFSQEKIEQIFLDENLLDTLRIPLFLTMYVSLSKDNTAVAQGEILRLFFSERRKNIDMYTNQGRLETMEHNLRFADRTIQYNRITAEMYHFMLDFVLPDIAWYMEKNEKFYLSVQEISSHIIERLLSRTEALDVCGEFGREVFDQYGNGARVDRDVLTVAEDIIEIMGGEGNTAHNNIYRNITNVILECCMITLGVLQKNHQKFGFVHQHIRDYFAAVKHINVMKMAAYMYEEGEAELTRECLNQTFYERPLDFTIRKFIGEYLGEHKNKPFYDEEDELCYGVSKDSEDRSRIDRILHIYRGADCETMGYGLYSLLKIITEVRGCLAGCDLSDLDLSTCALNGSKLGIYGLAANVNGAKINPQLWLFSGHQTQIEMLSYSEDKSRVLSADRSGKICVWDAKTGILLREWKVNGDSLNYAAFVEQDKKILAMYSSVYDRTMGDSYLSLWDSCTGELIEEKRLGISADIVLSHNKKSALVYNHQLFFVMNINDCTVKQFYEAKGMLRAAVFGKADKQIVFLELDKVEMRMTPMLRVYDLEEEEIIQEIKVPENGLMSSLCYAKGRVYIDVVKGLENVFLCVNLRDESVEKVICQPYFTGPCENPAKHMLFIEDSKVLVIWNENQMWIYDEMYRLVKNHHFKKNQSCTALLYDEQEETVIIGTRAADIYVYNRNDFRVQLERKGAVSDIISFDYSNDGRYLAVLYSRGTVRLWNMKKHRIVNEYQIELERKEITNYDDARIYFSPKGRMLFCSIRYLELTGVDGDPRQGKMLFSSVLDGDNVLIWSVPDFKLLHKSHHSHIFCSPNENYAAMTNIYKNQTKIVNRRTWNIEAEISNALGVGFLDNTRVLFVCKEEGLCKVYNLSNQAWECEIPMQNDDYVMTAIGDTCFAIGYSKHPISVFDSTSYKEIISYERNTEGEMFGLRFSNNGKYLIERLGHKAGGDNDATIRNVDNFEIVYEKALGKGTIEFFGTDSLMLETEMSYSNKTNVFVKDVYTQESVLVDRIDADGKQLFSIHPQSFDFALRKNSAIIDLYSVEKTEDGIRVIKKEEIEDIPGLEIIGLDLTEVQEFSSVTKFTKEQKELLYRYGAIVG